MKLESIFICLDLTFLPIMVLNFLKIRHAIKKLSLIKHFFFKY